MKIGVIILALSVILLSLGFSIGSIDIMFESKVVSFSVLVMIGTGCCLLFIGISSLIRSIKDTKKINHIKEKRMVASKPIDGRIIKFFFTWIASVFFGLIVLYGTGYLLGNNDQNFYQFAVPGLVFGAFLFAVSTSLQN